MLICVNVAEVCDARDDDSSTTARHIKNYKMQKRLSKNDNLFCIMY